MTDNISKLENQPGEVVIWTERAGMADFKVHPLLWVKTIATLGGYFVYLYVQRLNSRYTLTDQRIIQESGILTKNRDEIELFRIKDTKATSGFFQRFVGYGNITILSADKSGTYILKDIPDAHNKREQIRSAVYKSKEINGIKTIVNE